MRAVRHKLQLTWDPEHRVWQGTCSCSKWYVHSKTKSKVEKEFDSHTGK